MLISQVPLITAFKIMPLAAIVAGVTALGGTPALAQLGDSEIDARYSVRFNGMYMGKLKFNSRIKNNRYKLKSDTDLKVPILGSLFKSLAWRGATRTDGAIQDNRPLPKNYYFSYKSSKKRGQIDIAFAGNKVKDVKREPKKVLSSAYVPVQKHHLKNVLDPMSALMMISRKGRSHRSVCKNNVPVYDGTQRFNLRLSYKRTVIVKSDQTRGKRMPVIVCRVRYEPISGYKPTTKDIKYMARNKDIELWLMPLPRSRNYAPYRFVVPLPLGTADADLAHFSIRKKNGRRVALIRQ